jgi:hypothetical protein
LRVTVAALLLYYIFSHIGLNVVYEAIGNIDTPQLCVAFLIAIIVELVVSYRLKRLTDSYNLNLSTMFVFEVNLATRFYGLFLPGGNVTALLIRIFKFTKERSQVASVVMSLLADRVVATLSLCLIGLLFWALSQPKPDRLWLITFALSTIGCLILAHIVFNQPQASQLGGMKRLLQRLSPYFWSKFSKLFHRHRPTGNKIFLNSFSLSLVAHLLGIICYWFIAQSLDMSLSLLVIAWIRSGIILLTLLPITIAGLGVREVSALLLLQPYGIEPDIIIAFSILVFATTIFGIGLLGGLTEAWRLTIGKQQTA